VSTTVSGQEARWQSRLKLDQPEIPSKRGGLAVMFIFKGAAHFGRFRSRKTKPVKRILSPSPPVRVFGETR